MIRLSFLGVVHRIFQLTGARHAKAKLVGKSCCRYQQNWPLPNRCARSACFFFLLHVIHKIFQAHLGASYPSKPRAKLAGEVARKSYLCPHAAHGYRIKLQHQGYTARRTTDNIYIYHEKSRLNRLVWGSLTLAPISAMQVVTGKDTTKKVLCIRQ